MITKRSVFVPALLVALGLAFAMFGPASAQAPHLNVKLGLWEATTVAQTSGAPPIDMSNMTPDRRARMEAMLEKMKKSEATPHTFKTCLTKEKLDKSPFQDKNQESCKETVVSSSTTEYDVKFQCNEENGSAMSGQWRFEAATPELVKGNGEFTIERAGRKMESNSTLTAKWIGDSCGDVK